VSNHEMQDLLPLYALDALEGDELSDLERHLETCPECRRELDGYLAGATALVVDEPASDEGWARIRAAIGGDDASVVTPITRERADTSVWKWVASAAAVAALVLAGFLAVQLTDNGPAGDSAVVAAADAAAGESGSIVADFTVDDVAVAEVVLAPDGRGFLIPTDDLQPLDADRTYQLWVINDETDVISAGVFGPDPSPATFTWTGDVSGFALTREVAGGVVSSAGDVVSVISDL
jgi:anti-sigma-K factor RskA